MDLSGDPPKCVQYYMSAEKAGSPRRPCVFRDGLCKMGEPGGQRPAVCGRERCTRPETRKIVNYRSGQRYHVGTEASTQGRPPSSALGGSERSPSRNWEGPRAWGRVRPKGPPAARCVGCNTHVMYSASGQRREYIEREVRKRSPEKEGECVGARPCGRQLHIALSSTRPRRSAARSPTCPPRARSRMGRRRGPRASGWRGPA